MGLLVDGQWQDVWYDTKSTGGRFVRSKAQFRHWITSDGSAGPTGDEGFTAAADRYHLYISYACPWAHRTLIYRSLKGLENFIDISVVHWYMGEHGWTFQAEEEGIVADKLFNAEYAYEIYLKADLKYTGRVTVPILWDKQNNTIVNNESSDIIRMFNNAFDQIGAKEGDYYPELLRPEIDELNERIYHNVNNGVYKAGFATSQKAYDEAVKPLFETLDWLDERLAKQRFLCGSTPTEADWRLFPTLFRFDAIYVGHFKCAKKRIQDYEHLSQYARDLYQWPGIDRTVKLEHAIRHYYESHRTINPHGIVPIASMYDWDTAHDRRELT